MHWMQLRIVTQCAFEKVFLRILYLNGLGRLRDIICRLFKLCYFEGQNWAELFLLYLIFPSGFSSKLYSGSKGDLQIHG